MSRVPPAHPRVTERAFQAGILDLARRTGWLAAHVHDSRRQVAPGRLVGDRDAAGFPDLVLCRGNRLVLAELKADRGRVRPSQRRWLDALRVVESDAAGRVIVREWRPDDWPEVERLLAGRGDG